VTANPAFPRDLTELRFRGAKGMSLRGATPESASIGEAATPVEFREIRNDAVDGRQPLGSVGSERRADWRHAPEERTSVGMQRLSK
jgi:hypothetical protein